MTKEAEVPDSHFKDPIINFYTDNQVDQEHEE
jgi:hypothetical protein